VIQKNRIKEKREKRKEKVKSRKKRGIREKK